MSKMKWQHVSRRIVLASAAVAAALACSGCANVAVDNSGALATNPHAISDIRETMLASARANDVWFPDGEGKVLTQFAYIGTVETQEGLIRVVSCRSIITGMLSPRGQSWLSFHADDGEFLASQLLFSGAPLWCEGSRIFFFGLQGSDAEGVGGNALELADGIESARWVIERREGSW
jgi:hypothetical protein